MLCILTHNSHELIPIGSYSESLILCVADEVYQFSNLQLSLGFYSVSFHNMHDLCFLNLGLKLNTSLVMIIEPI